MKALFKGIPCAAIGVLLLAVGSRLLRNHSYENGWTLEEYCERNKD
jgi:hypothetical protein